MPDKATMTTLPGTWNKQWPMKPGNGWQLQKLVADFKEGVVKEFWGAAMKAMKKTNKKAMKTSAAKKKKKVMKAMKTKKAMKKAKEDNDKAEPKA